MLLSNCQVNLVEKLQENYKKLGVFPSAEMKEIMGFLKAHPLEK